MNWTYYSLSDSKTNPSFSRYRVLNFKRNFGPSWIYWMSSTQFYCNLAVLFMERRGFIELNLLDPMACRVSSEQIILTKRCTPLISVQFFHRVRIEQLKMNDFFPNLAHFSKKESFDSILNKCFFSKTGKDTGEIQQIIKLHFVCSIQTEWRNCTKCTLFFVKNICSGAARNASGYNKINPIRVELTS